MRGVLSPTTPSVRDEVECPVSVCGRPSERWSTRWCHILSMGRQWTQLPKDLPPRSTVNDYFSPGGARVHLQRSGDRESRLEAFESFSPANRAFLATRPRWLSGSFSLPRS